MAGCVLGMMGKNSVVAHMAANPQHVQVKGSLGQSRLRNVGQ